MYKTWKTFEKFEQVRRIHRSNHAFGLLPECISLLITGYYFKKLRNLFIHNVKSNNQAGIFLPESLKFNSIRPNQDLDNDNKDRKSNIEIT